MMKIVNKVILLYDDQCFAYSLDILYMKLEKCHLICEKSCNYRRIKDDTQTLQGY